jgi:hypothetical protein
MTPCPHDRGLAHLPCPYSGCHAGTHLLFLPDPESPGCTARRRVQVDERGALTVRWVVLSAVLR